MQQERALRISGNSPSGEYFRYVKIFGERNTGTNYLSRLIELNFFVTGLRGDTPQTYSLSQAMSRNMPSTERKAFRLGMQDEEIGRIFNSDFGWKHSAPAVDAILQQVHAKHTMFLVLTKHPFTWIQSLHKNPYDYSEKTQDFSSFIRQPFTSSLSDNLSGCGLFDPLTMFRLKVLRYKRLEDSGLATMRIGYEKLIQNVPEHIEFLSKVLCRRGAKVRNVEKDVKGSERVTADFVRQYATGVPGDGLSVEDRQYIIETIGRDVFEYLNYEI